VCPPTSAIPRRSHTAVKSENSSSTSRSVVPGANSTVVNSHRGRAPRHATSLALMSTK
jgi:hypothetical protein